MANLKLFHVTVTSHAVVLAESSEEAARVAREFRGDIENDLPDGKIAVIGEVNSPDKLPDDWQLNYEPYSDYMTEFDGLDTQYFLNNQVLTHD